MNLWQLQSTIQEIEDGLNSDDTNLDDLVGELRGKVDSLKSVIDTLDAEGEKFKRYAKEMSERGRSIANASERLKAYVLKSLEAHGTTFEIGNVWVAKIKESESLNMKFDPTPDMVMDMSINEYIKTTYSWDKAGIKKAIKAGSSDFEALATIEKNKSLNFSLVNPNSKK